MTGFFFEAGGMHIFFSFSFFRDRILKALN